MVPRMSNSLNTPIDVQNPRKRILMVAANPTQSKQTGWPIGFWWAELTHPYHVFIEAGYDVEIRSPDGGPLEGDGYSDPEHDSGYSADDIITLGFKTSVKHRALIENTKSLEDAMPADYDAIFFVGGQSPMYTLIDNAAVHARVRDFYEAGKITALVCHATCMLLRIKLSNGDFLAKGKSWTGFTDEEEKSVEDMVGQKVQPFWIEQEARKLSDTNFVGGPAFQAFAMRDGRLITGQQQASGAATANLVVEALGR